MPLAQRSIACGVLAAGMQIGAIIAGGTEVVGLPVGRSARLDLIRHPGAAAVVPFLSGEEVLLLMCYACLGS